MVPVLIGDFAPGELVAGRAGVDLVVVVVEVLERGGHDPALREEAGPRQVEQAGKELATGQVPGGPEQNDDMRSDRRVVVVDGDGGVTGGWG
jgi:hypothetical protein